MNLKKLLNFYVVHKHAGGDYVIIQDCGDGYVRVALHRRSGFSPQAFLVVAEMLSPIAPLPSELLESCAALWAELESGEKKVVNTWIKQT